MSILAWDCIDSDRYIFHLSVLAIGQGCGSDFKEIIVVVTPFAYTMNIMYMCFQSMGQNSTKYAYLHVLLQ